MQFNAGLMIFRRYSRFQAYQCEQDLTNKGAAFILNHTLLANGLDPGFRRDKLNQIQQALFNVSQTSNEHGKSQDELKFMKPGKDI